MMMKSLDVYQMTDDQAVDKNVEVDLEPIGRRVIVPIETTILAAAQLAGVELASICGGIGTCGACRVRLIEGKLSPLTLTEREELNHDELVSGIRLACQACVMDSVRVDIPPESLTTSQRLQVEGREVHVELDPIIHTYQVELIPPGLTDLRSDLTRLQGYLQCQGHREFAIRYPALVELSTILRENNWKATVVTRDNEIITLLPPDMNVYGLAIDVGTTKLAAYLVNLENGEIVSKAGAMNPQIGYGEDVISRIAYVNENKDGLKTLQRKLVDTLNDLTVQLTSEAGISHQQIVDAVVVGNTAMHHILAGLPVNQLGTSPYVPAVSDELEIPNNLLGLKISPSASIYLPPNIAGYVGADHVAMLIAAEAAQHRQNAHAIVSLDIGTNTEISLYYWGRHLCCSCASGPAFEGAHIRDGMRAAPGAIERVRMEDAEVHIQTINNRPAVGICGSGILDTVSGLLAIKILDERGVFKGKHARLRQNSNRHEFILVPSSQSGHGREIIVTRRDVNEIQLAKGAIRAGVEVLLDEVGITENDIDEFIVAGAFGTYIDLESAIHVGMFPDIPRDRFRQIGNAAGLGAKGLLISKRLRKQAKEIAKVVDYIELTTHPGFTRAYMDALAFKKI
jgi:uncharacterized 2Fe-2S/4Fe-4S cluster protein (DUF4445 family)